MKIQLGEMEECGPVPISGLSPKRWTLTCSARVRRGCMGSKRCMRMNRTALCEILLPLQRQSQISQSAGCYLLVNFFCHPISFADFFDLFWEHFFMPL